MIRSAVIKRAPTVLRSKPMVRPRRRAKPSLIHVTGILSLVARSSLMKVSSVWRQSRVRVSNTRALHPRVIKTSVWVIDKISPNKKPLRSVEGAFKRERVTKPRARLPWENIARSVSLEVLLLPRVREEVRPEICMRVTATTMQKPAIIIKGSESKA